MTKQGSIGIGTTSAGELIDHLVGFREDLARSGYGPVRSGAHLELFADLCGWLGREGLALSELASDRVAAFLDDRRARGHRDLVSMVGAPRLSGEERRHPSAGVRRPRGPWSRVHRGLSALPRSRARARAAWRRALREAREPFRRLARARRHHRLAARASPRRHELCFSESPDQRAMHAPDVVPVLRSFLRFALLEGVIVLPLHDAVPPVAGG